MKFNLIILVAVFLVAAMIMPTQVLACIKNRDGCQPDGSQGNCCSGNCHKEPGWVAGYCR
uniref:Alo-2 n=1 Tax=Conogethes punctiferalis TaxID=1133088 RepID=A0A894J8M1_CONPF|nr:Alo-2 [Conogethes punctiferalis]